MIQSAAYAGGQSHEARGLGNSIWAPLPAIRRYAYHPPGWGNKGFILLLLLIIETLLHTMCII